MKLTIEQERQITAQYQYIKELATLKYDAEEKRRTKHDRIKIKSCYLLPLIRGR